MFQKLEAVEKRFEELTTKISDPEVISNQNEWRELMKEHAELEPIVEKYREYKKVQKEYEEAGLTFSQAKEKVYVLSGIDEIEIWALFTQMEDGIHYSASLRSRTIPIRDVAVEYHGGGHECASGIKNLTLDQVHEIIDILSKRS